MTQHESRNGIIGEGSKVGRGMRHEILRHRMMASCHASNKVAQISCSDQATSSKRVAELAKNYFSSTGSPNTQEETDLANNSNIHTVSELTSQLASEST